MIAIEMVSILPILLSPIAMNVSIIPLAINTIGISHRILRSTDGLYFSLWPIWPSGREALEKIHDRVRNRRLEHNGFGQGSSM